MVSLTLLVAKIVETLTTYNVDEVVVGIETTAQYYEDLVSIFHEKGYTVRVINRDATTLERDYLLSWSKMDNIDLSAIIHSILQGVGGIQQYGSCQDRCRIRLVKFSKSFGLIPNSNQTTELCLLAY